MPNSLPVQQPGPVVPESICRLNLDGWMVAGWVEPQIYYVVAEEELTHSTYNVRNENGTLDTQHYTNYYAQSYRQSIDKL